MTYLMRMPVNLKKRRTASRTVTPYLTSKFCIVNIPDSGARPAAAEPGPEARHRRSQRLLAVRQQDKRESGHQDGGYQPQNDAGIGRFGS